VGGGGKEREGGLTIEPAAHGGVEREVDGFEDDFAIFEVGGFGGGFRDELEGLAGHDVVLGAGGEHDGLVGGRHGWVRSRSVKGRCLELL
jgi:hypothetical protein